MGLKVLWLARIHHREGHGADFIYTCTYAPIETMGEASIHVEMGAVGTRRREGNKRHSYPPNHPPVIFERTVIFECRDISVISKELAHDYTCPERLAKDTKRE